MGPLSPFRKNAGQSELSGKPCDEAMSAGTWIVGVIARERQSGESFASETRLYPFSIRPMALRR